ncbi:hypothetical protein CROQUDRAFT_136374 [Cronartium quercuum f. sp. fusiforme G11]|uniref:Uncharacterized protein n=1 Tax=Cronartium quercuum f. sp. fusiforme G11 TaxID=708437 RepID=A0A9P6T814_9BASI|nr:hypothetical protein CROQUDRAFT_136374 [Cronartium quercuum f. sp. fusiforme G11]
MYLEAQKSLIMISHTIEISRMVTAPAFVGVLHSLNQNQEATSGLEDLLLHGGEFLQEYFSQWKHLKMKEGDLTGILQLSKGTASSADVSGILHSSGMIQCFIQPFDQTSALALKVMLLDEEKSKEMYTNSL